MSTQRSPQRTSIGLDVHARSVVAAALDGTTAEITKARLTPSHTTITSWISALPGPVRVVYEAGPTGFGLARHLTAAGIEVVVAAPSKLLRPAGDRVKTDMRDALHLARLCHLGEITAVTVPSAAAEDARDLVRAREDARGDLMAVRHRLRNLLLRQGIVYSGGAAWTGAHDRWLHQVRREQLAGVGLLAAFDADYEAVLAAAARRDRLDAAITAMAASSEFSAVTARLACLRGVSTLTAFALAVEIGDWHRLSGASIGAYVGLVPTESSSGTSRRQGGVTKTGNAHVRRLLVEAAWHHRAPWRGPGRDLQARWALAPAAAAARGAAGNRRLHARWAAFTARKKQPTVANAAIARELAGWCWSLATVGEGEGARA